MLACFFLWQMQIGYDKTHYLNVGYLFDTETGEMLFEAYGKKYDMWLHLTYVERKGCEGQWLAMTNFI